MSRGLFFFFSVDVVDASIWFGPSKVCCQVHLGMPKVIVDLESAMSQLDWTIEQTGRHLIEATNQFNHVKWFISQYKLAPSLSDSNGIWTHNHLVRKLPECQGFPYSKQARYLKFNWQEWNLSLQPLSR